MKSQIVTNWSIFCISITALVGFVISINKIYVIMWPVDPLTAIICFGSIGFFIMMLVVDIVLFLKYKFLVY